MSAFIQQVYLFHSRTPQREFGDAVFESSFEKESIFCLRLKLDYVIGFSGQMIKSEIGENVSHSIHLWFAFNC